MSTTPRAARWLKMADDARRMADRTRDPEVRRVMLEVADNYEKLAAWAAKTDAADTDRLD
jgi:hypothetical protein